MPTITCYGAVREIGGNKILLQDGGSRIMLDFGKGFSAEGMFFDEFLQPRTNSALRDLLTLRILPPIPGIYRRDLLTHAGVWPELKKKGIPDSSRKLFEIGLESYDDYTAKHGPAIDGILLSHGHTDHCQHLCFVDPRIPVYCTSATLAILKAAEEMGRGGYDSDICGVKTRSWSTYGSAGTFEGELKVAPDTDGPPRDFRVVEPYKPFAVGGYEVTAIPVDHSVPGACAFSIKCPSGKSVFYTGDLRFHGRFSLGTSNLTTGLREFARNLSPDMLITEGTRIESNTKDNESDVEKKIAEIVSGSDGLAIIDFGWKDTTRFQTIRNVAEATGRRLAISPKVAYLMNLLHTEDPANYPDITCDKTVCTYLKRQGSMVYSPADYSAFKHTLGLCTDWGPSSKDMKKAWPNDLDYIEPRMCHFNQGVRAYDVAAKPSSYILHAGYFDMNELFDLAPPAGSIFVRAATEPFCDEMVMDEIRLGNWLNFFGINDGAGIQRSHVSGHASGEDLLDFIVDMKPGRIVPIHTDKPELFAEALGAKFEVTQPEIAEKISF